MIFQREMIIFRMVSYNSLGFGALILGSNSLLIIKTFFTDVIYKLFSIFPIFFQYFGALILEMNSLLIIKTFFTDVIYKLFQYFHICIILGYR